MKKLITLVALLLSSSAFAVESIDLTTKYVVDTYEVSCRLNAKVGCNVDADTGEEFCAYNFFYTEDSFTKMRTHSTGVDKLSRNPWFAKSPTQMCNEGLVPMQETGQTAEVFGIQFNTDRTPLTDILESI